MNELLRETIGHPLFKDMVISDVERLGQVISEERFDPGAIILREGQPADRVYLVCSGKVAIDLPLPNRNALTIATSGAPAVIGWSWIFPDHQWHFQARAMEPTRTIVIDGKGLLEMFERDHAFGYETIRRISRMIHDRLQSTTQQLLDAFDVP